MIGRVVSVKMNNTATVLVERVTMHPLYKKTFLRSKKYLVDMPVTVKEGDIVEIIKIRPISKNKHWRITKTVGKSLAEITEEKLKKQAEEVISEVMPETSESVDQSISVSEVQQVSKSEKNNNKKQEKKEEKNETKTRTGQSVRKSKSTK